MFQGRGGSSGSSSSSANVVPDSIRSKDTLEFILGLCEGQIQGLERGAKSFFIGDTQLQNEDGTINFPSFLLQLYTGSPSGETIIPRLGGSASSHTVNVELGTATPVLRTTQSRNITSIRLRLTIAQLYRTDNNGQYKNTITWRVEFKKHGDSVWTNPYGGDISIDDKTTSTYVKEIQFAVASISTDDYDIRVTKISHENDQNNVRDISWESFQEINSSNLIFPNTAVMQGLGEATNQLSSVPQFSGVYQCKIIRVPSNYDPVARTYAGNWDGTWKMAYSNNPAFVLYDYTQDDSAGLAAYYNINLDKYDVYEAGQWCDVMIPQDPSNPASEVIPRYTCNIEIADPRSGKELAAYISGIFNGIIVDDLNGNARLLFDKDDTAVQVITKENMVGLPVYSYTDITARYNDLTVTFDNPAMAWQTDRRRVFDQNLIDTYGRVPLDFIAVGCIDPDEAVRRARWKLLSSTTECAQIVFKTTRMAEYIDPFSVILIADSSLGYGVTGRIIGQNGAYLNLRDPIYLETGITYIFRSTVPNPDYGVAGTVTGGDATIVVSANVVNPTRGYVNILALDQALTLPEFAAFSLEQPGGIGLPKPFRVISIEEDSSSAELYTITAVEVNRNKTSGADGFSSGAIPIYTWKNPDLPVITGLVAAESVYYINGFPYSAITVSWVYPTTVLIKTFQVTYIAPDGGAGNCAPTDQNTIDIKPAQTGTYTISVQGISTDGRLTPATTTTFTSVGKTTKPAPPTGLSAAGANGEIDLSWVPSPDRDVAYYLVHESQDNVFTHSNPIAHATGSSYARKYLHYGDARYFWLTTVDFAGNESDPSNMAYAEVGYLQITDVIALNSITNDQLSHDLAATIGSITGPASDPTSVAGKIAAATFGIADDNNNKISAAQDAMNQKVDSLASGDIEDAAQAILAAMLDHADGLASFRGAVAQARSELQAYTDKTTFAESQQRIQLASVINSNFATVDQHFLTLTNQQESFAASILTINANFNGVNASLQSESSTRATADGALSQQILTLSASVGPQISAAVSTETSARASADESLAQQTSDLYAKNNSNVAAIQSEATARATADGATSTRIDSLQASYNDSSGRIQSLESVTTGANGVTSQYLLQAQALSNGKVAVAGIGVLAAINNGTAQSEIILLANKTIITGTDPNGNQLDVAPFTVQWIPAINAYGVVMTAAYAGTLDAGKLTSGTITAALLTIRPTAAGQGLQVFKVDGTKILDTDAGLFPGSSSTNLVASVPSVGINNTPQTIVNRNFTFSGRPFQMQWQCTTDYTASGGLDNNLIVLLFINGNQVYGNNALATGVSQDHTWMPDPVPGTFSVAVQVATRGPGSETTLRNFKLTIIDWKA